jgi:hypothetical protein
MVLANADEQQARAYIKHLLGIEVGVKSSDANHVISFLISPQDYKEAKAKLEQKFDRAPLTRTASGYTFYVDDTKTRRISIMSGIGTGGLRCYISLSDQNHYNSYPYR